MWSQRPYTFDRVVRIFFTAVVVCVALYFMYVLRRVLLPFCVGCLIAYMIEPCVKWNQRVLHIKSNTWAVLLTTFEALLFFGAFCAVVVPLVGSEFSNMALLLDKYVRNRHPLFMELPTALHEFIHSHLDVNKLIAEVERVNVTELADSLWRGITSGLDRILGILGWLIVVIYVIFILLDFDKYMNTARKLIPRKFMPTVSAIGQDVSYTMKRYFRNQALISFIVGILYIVGFSIVGIPMAVVIGLLCMVLFMVPYMVYITVIPVIAMCVFKSMETGVDFWVVLLECAAVYITVETFSDLFLTPKIMGKALGLNPAIILLALSVWGTLLGILGMLIALPATTIIFKWTDLWLTNLRNKEDAPSGPAPPPAHAAPPPPSYAASPPEPLETD